MICFDVTVRLLSFSLWKTKEVRSFVIEEVSGVRLMVYGVMIRLDSTVGLEINFYFIKHALLWDCRWYMVLMPGISGI